ncbi:LicD family protein [uncultured Parolsenella sp.]|uniref:LicD family protein n=1 Tax=uncultured Parolsenella sp. TaxID=2083008 RepID=UPI0025E74410|nr:LicD family protein [uncultured Parolsenella sp.]
MKSGDALSRLKTEELSILDAIAVACEANDITWWLDGGTCLGAMRHEGFIPWDDDIDIGMLRSDYDRFCELAPEELPEGFSLHTSDNTGGYAAMFAKVYKDGTRFENQEGRDAGSSMGIFVDIFPYDCLYEDQGLRAKQISRASRAQRRSYLYHSNAITVPHKGMLGSIEKAGCKLLHAIERISTKDPHNFQREFNSSIPDQSIGAISEECLTLAWPNMDPMPVDDILPTAKASFEGEIYPVPRRAEKYLTVMYGDWKTIPAPEERHTHLPLLIDFGNGEIWESDK